MGDSILFTKIQSLGNDFVLVNEEDVLPLIKDPSTLEAFLPRFAAVACERHFGIGSDGLLVVTRGTVDLKMRMFNPDGTEDFCGNGLRCAGFYALENGWFQPGFVIGHLNQSIPVTREADGEISTVIGPANYDPDVVPVRCLDEVFNKTVWSGMVDGQPLSYFGSSLTTGSTHTIIPTVTLPDDATFLSVGPLIECDHRFPSRTSVIWVKEVSPNVLSLRIWERGAGETMGCGTGSAAAAADYMRRRDRGGRIEVRNPGGTVWVKAEKWDKLLTLSATVTIVFTGNYPILPNLL